MGKHYGTPGKFANRALFAFLNAGIILSMSTLQAMEASSLAHGIILGLVVGKPLGIGFTMSIFVATLIFEGATELLTEAKASIMLATSIAGLAGISLLLVLNKRSLS
ncbi:MAG: Na+/H+ antiporter NhaA [Paraglaciecola chathamensis]